MEPSNSGGGGRDNSVALRIKSPSARHPDLLLSCDRQLSVRGLKGLIETRYPAHTPPADQKLVYAGKLLTDELLLEQFLRFEDDCSVFTIHLVCRIPEQAKRDQQTVPHVPEPDTAAEGARYRGPTPLSSPAIVAAADGREIGENIVAVEQLSAEARELARIQELLQGLTVPSPAATALGEEEMRQMQDIYREYVQLYSQHLQHVQQAAPNVGAVAAAHHHSHLHHHRHHRQEDHQLRPHFEGGAAARRPAAVGAAVAAEEEEINNNNDLLDRVYAFTRILLLFSVIYFHSSFFRLLFVAVIAFLAHRFQNNLPPQANNNNNGRARNHNELIINHREDHNDANGRIENLNNNVNDNGDGVRDDQNGSDMSEIPPRPETVEEEDKPNLLVVAITFVSSFISSIIPGNNPPP